MQIVVVGQRAIFLQHIAAVLERHLLVRGCPLKTGHCIADRLKIEEIEGVLPYTSFTNFILFRVENFSANYVYEKLIEKGVSIRDLSGVRGLSNHLRVTVGTEEENKIFLEKLQEVFYEGSERDF